MYGTRDGVQNAVQKAPVSSVTTASYHQIVEAASALLSASVPSDWANGVCGLRVRPCPCVVFGILRLTVTILYKSLIHYATDWFARPSYVS